MIKEYKIPTPGESISEVEIAAWMVEDGAWVDKNDEVAEVESDKATLIMVAEESGIISIKAPVGKTVAVGSVAYTIDVNTEKPVSSGLPKEQNALDDHKIEPVIEEQVKIEKLEQSAFEHVKVTPVAAEIMKENDLSIEDVISGLRRLTKQDIQKVLTASPEIATTKSVTEPLLMNMPGSREVSGEKMSMLRRRLSERLVSVKNETAMLTTFNEIDMSAVMEIRKNLQPKFEKKYGFKLGFMGFFTKAVSIAAQLYPAVNSQIDGDEIVKPNYVDVGIAVQSPKGLMVPIVRNAELLTVPQIEAAIKELAQKARDKKITMDELTGGTISITNGGVFGSLLSTPILNPPQSAILGMHNIVERPIAENGQVVIRPMMYVALSYDHRIVDGKDSVGFLVKVKEMIENPQKMLYMGADPMEKLLDL